MTISDKKRTLRRKLWNQKLGQEYFNIHAWIGRHHSKANKCENNSLHINRRYEWANIDGIYERNIKHFKSLCVPCHRSRDWTDKQRVLQTIRMKKMKYASKPIKQLDIKGNLIKIWQSSAEVYRELGILRTSLSNALHGRAKTAGGYLWQR